LLQHRLGPSLAAENGYREPRADSQGQSAASSLNRLHADRFPSIPFPEIIGDNLIRF
jgi:hypothetical protein